MPVLSRLAAALDDEDPTCTLHQLARLLGCRRLSDARLVRYVQELVDTEFFPAPYPAARHGGGLTRSVTRKSCWGRAAVDVWLHDFLPPAASASLDAAAMAAAATDLDAAAASLGQSLRLVGGTEA